MFYITWCFRNTRRKILFPILKWTFVCNGKMGALLTSSNLYRGQVCKIELTSKFKHFFSLLHFFQAKNAYARLKGTTSGCGEKIVYAYFVYFFFLINVRKQLWQKKSVGRKLTFNFVMIQNPQNVAFERFSTRYGLKKK